MPAPLRALVLAVTATLALLTAHGRAPAQAAGTTVLQLEAKIPLGNVNGRIDHMAIDVARQRLFVAELATTVSGSLTSVVVARAPYHRSVEGTAGRSLRAFNGYRLRRKRGRWVGASVSGAGPCAGRRR
jgi:hypothetical protein